MLLILENVYDRIIHPIIFSKMLLILRVQIIEKVIIIIYTAIVNGYNIYKEIYASLIVYYLRDI